MDFSISETQSAMGQFGTQAFLLVGGKINNHQSALRLQQP